MGEEFEWENAVRYGELIYHEAKRNGHWIGEVWAGNNHKSFKFLVAVQGVLKGKAQYSSCTTLADAKRFVEAQYILSRGE